jgi:hypothetical protein
VKRIILLFLLSAFLYSKIYVQLPSKNIEYFYIKGQNKGPKIVIIGGIHGNETGGYLTAGLLNKLKINRGEILVIPRASIISIMANQRGYNGDMNKKFDCNVSNDKDFKYVMKIKKLILDFKPELLISLHDGYGFSINDKKAWGQSIVIDEIKYKNFELLKTAKKLQKLVNKKLKYKIGLITTFTFTKKGSYNKNGLSGWSLKHGIEAYSLEASKNIPLKEKLKTHKTLLKEFLKLKGIKNNIEDLKLEIKKPIVKLLINGKEKIIHKNTLLVLPKNSKIKFLNLNKDGYYIVPRGVNLNWDSFYFKDVKFDIKYGYKKLFTIEIREK